MRFVKISRSVSLRMVASRRASPSTSRQPSWFLQLWLHLGYGSSLDLHPLLVSPISMGRLPDCQGGLAGVYCQFQSRSLRAGATPDLVTRRLRGSGAQGLKIDG